MPALDFIASTVPRVSVPEFLGPARKNGLGTVAIPVETKSLRLGESEHRVGTSDGLGRDFDHLQRLAESLIPSECYLDLKNFEDGR